MKKSNFAIIGAVFTALLSTLCCLPAFIFLFFGVSSGVLSFFTTLEYTRVPLAILAIIFFIFTIYTFRKKISCSCNKKEKTKQYFLFTIFFILILLLLFYPELIPLFME
ncbi:mercuric transporter MerT family protein [Aliarcobacter butzleri]|uniref:mercuric transporter MerT family protein n=1 Tax=Aliarcobacter butzleri TaxID=28197 RepID=UPI00125F26B5|nr:mercuric transporter MerT family protein [Aliarcobacter butzleri]MCT7551178.1 mercuric transporter MerT family protein [Aliarcobacter butzleri]MCT7560150.1 mercuric transporter MerT family protein [Aliarcobacter butzleri]MCT7626988.1 mercuric transporter MerT family protein [Aliarcobacter butzleri]MCT7638059.1 mercuric transporter MerT family protein [Aliarcobacter butzleri]MCT7644581.1 mercuric transporter MerT family protein [Aliarcobacter butzleri]